MESFWQLIGVPKAVLDVDGSVVTGDGWQMACTDFHRVNAESFNRCLQSDTALVDNMTQGVPYAIYRCFNGLVGAAAPITVDGLHLVMYLPASF